MKFIPVWRKVHVHLRAAETQSLKFSHTCPKITSRISGEIDLAIPRTTMYKPSMTNKPARNSNPDFLNGVPELLVLRLLARRPMYGYQLVRAIEQSSGQVLEFGEGCIYPVLHRLES